MFVIDERVPLTVTRHECHFDRACEAAYELAADRFGVDDGGHMRNVADSCRSTDAINVEFVGYSVSCGMGGISHRYQFTAWVSRHKDEGE